VHSEKRKSQRKPFERHAWVELADGSVIECELGNLSDTGAKLVFDALKELPDQFILRLAQDGRVVRKCRTAWKADREIGVEFIARPVLPVARPVLPVARPVRTVDR
jgi:hypothetical protein